MLLRQKLIIQTLRAAGRPLSRLELVKWLFALRQQSEAVVGPTATAGADTIRATRKTNRMGRTPRDHSDFGSAAGTGGLPPGGGAQPSLEWSILPVSSWKT